MSNVELIIAEAKQQSDVGRSIARIDSETMKTLGAKKGETIKIVGKKITAAKAFPGYHNDKGLGLIRLDG